MNINRENYEMYFLDYHEGRLEPGQVAELLVFLELNPEPKEEFRNFEAILVTPDMSIFFEQKSALKKNNVSISGPINASNYETYFIADTEKQLTPEEQHWLTGFLEINPGLNNIYRLYLHTRLQPDTRIQYPGKAALKRSILNTRRIYYYALSAAASIALLLAVFMHSGTQQEPVLTARQKPFSIPAPVNRNVQRAIIPLQKIPAPVMAFNAKTANIPATSHPLASQAAVENEQQKGDRKPVKEIHSLLVARVASRDIVAPEYIFIRQSRNSPETYANLYDQVNLADRMQHEQVLAPVVSSHKSLLKTGLRKLGGIFTGKEEAPANTVPINFWTLADLGISGYNLLTDKDVQLLTQSNENGKVVSYGLKSDEFEFMHILNKSKNR
jgi:hypothetical protein